METHLTAMIQGQWKLASEKTELIYLYLPTSYFRFHHLSKHDTSYSSNTSLKISQPFWVVTQWLKTDNMTFFDF